MPKPKVAKKSTTSKYKSGDGGTTAEEKILNTLAAHKVKFSQDSVDKKKLGALAKVPGASTVRNVLAKLKKKGWVVVTSETVAITDLGLQNANVDNVQIPTSNEEKHASVKAELKPKEVEVFDKISDGRVHKKGAVREAVAVKGESTWRNLLAGLKKKNIIECTKDTIQLTKDMFPIIPRPE